MKIKVNGIEKNFNTQLTIIELIDFYKLEYKAIVVERNGEIVRRDDYKTTKIQNNDVIELVRFVGGG